MDDLAKDGLRVHMVEPNSPQDAVSIGETRTAVCGVTWKTTIVDREELNKLPLCYGCVEYRAVQAFADFRAFTDALNKYDADH